MTRPPFSSPDPGATTPVAKKAAAKAVRVRKRAAPKKTSPSLPATKKATGKPPAKAPAKKAPPRRGAPAPKPPSEDAAAPIEPAPKNGWPERKPGPVELAVRAELEEHGFHRSAFAASAIAMARNVDEAESPAGAASAARELRMVMPLAMTTRNPLSPPAPADDGDEDGKVVGPNRLVALRRKADKKTDKRASS